MRVHPWFSTVPIQELERHSSESWDSPDDELQEVARCSCLHLDLSYGLFGQTTFESSPLISPYQSRMPLTEPPPSKPKQTSTSPTSTQSSGWQSKSLLSSNGSMNLLSMSPLPTNTTPASGRKQSRRYLDFSEIVAALRARQTATLLRTYGTKHTYLMAVHDWGTRSTDLEIVSALLPKWAATLTH